MRKGNLIEVITYYNDFPDGKLLGIITEDHVGYVRVYWISGGPVGSFAWVMDYNLKVISEK